MTTGTETWPETSDVHHLTYKVRAQSDYLKVEEFRLKFWMISSRLICNNFSTSLPSSVCTQILP